MQPTPSATPRPWGSTKNASSPDLSHMTLYKLSGSELGTPLQYFSSGVGTPSRNWGRSKRHVPSGSCELQPRYQNFPSQTPQTTKTWSWSSEGSLWKLWPWMMAEENPIVSRKVKIHQHTVNAWIILNMYYVQLCMYVCKYIYIGEGSFNCHARLQRATTPQAVTQRRNAHPESNKGTRGRSCGFSQLPSGKLTVCCWKWPFIVDLPMRNGVFP